MLSMPFLALAAAASTIAGAQVTPQPVPIMAESGQQLPEYSAVADRVLAAPAIIDVIIRDAQRLKVEEAPGLSMGSARFYVTADVLALIRGPAGIAQRVTYLADVPLDGRGRPPKLKKMRAILFARPVAGRAGEVQLSTPDGQRAWTPALDTRVRDIAREVVEADAPPAITGIGNAFHVAGTLPGEGETQIFLNTADGRPVSLSILRRPGEQTRWAVALSEIVDDAAGTPRRDTLLWYRLACGLPEMLPDRALATMAAADAAIAREDYSFVRTSLGRCRA